jgi:hypothetical protein
METNQGISLWGYLYLKLAKTPCFSFYLLRFFFYKIGEQEGRTGSAGEGECWHQWEGEGGREKGWEDEYDVNNVYTEMIPVETVPGIGGGG